MCPLDPLCYLPFQSYHMPPNVVALPPGTFYCSKDTAVKMKNGKPIPNCRKLGIGFPFSFFTAVSLIMFRIGEPPHPTHLANLTILTNTKNR